MTARSPGSWSPANPPAPTTTPTTTTPATTAATPAMTAAGWRPGCGPRRPGSPRSWPGPRPSPGARPDQPSRPGRPTSRPGHLRPRLGLPRLCPPPGLVPSSSSAALGPWRPTDLANLALVCRAHHRAVHEGGWRLGRGPNGRLTATPSTTPPPTTPGRGLSPADKASDRPRPPCHASAWGPTTPGPPCKASGWGPISWNPARRTGHLDTPGTAVAAPAQPEPRRPHSSSRLKG